MKLTDFIVLFFYKKNFPLDLQALKDQWVEKG